MIRAERGPVFERLRRSSSLRRLGHAVLILAVLAIPQAHAADEPVPTLVEWWEDTDKRSPEIKKKLEEVTEAGLPDYYDKIARGAQSGTLCDPTTGVEKDWIAAFGRTMAKVSGDAWLGERSRLPRDSGEKEQLGRTFASQVTANENLSANLFKVETFGGESDDFRLFAAPNEVIIPGNESSQVATCLLFQSAVIEKAILKDKAQIRLLNIQSIEQADERWTNFLKNVTNDQYPWETLVNGGFFKGTLRTPPRQQIRLIHPLPVTITQLEGETTTEPSLVMQIVGLQRYKKEIYRPHFGASLIVSAKTSNDVSHGWGVMINYHKFSFGALVRDTAEQDDVWNAVLGVNIAQLFNLKKNGTATSSKEMLKMLEGALGN